MDDEARGWFSRIIPHPRTRLVAQILAFVLVCALVGLVWGFVSDKALGVTGTGHREHVSQAPQRCIDMKHEPCKQKAAHWAKRKFKKGEMGQMTHASAGSLFKHPRTARRAWIKKIDRALDRSARLHPTDRRPTAASVYHRWMRDSDCGGDTSYSPYSYGFNLCEFNGPKIATEDIQNMGTVALCGGGVVVGALAAPPTGTTSWWVIGIGSTSCFWGAWITMSED